MFSYNDVFKLFLKFFNGKMNIKSFPREYLLKIVLDITANNNCFSFKN